MEKRMNNRDSHTIDLLNEIAEFLENYEDVVDGSYGVPHPNTAMSLRQQVDQHIAWLQRQSGPAETPVEETDESIGDWQCRDYGDGWITFPDRKAAEKYQEDTQAMMRYRRFYPYEAKCPFPIENDDGSQKQCIAHGHCGCVHGTKAKSAATPERPGE